MKQQKTAIALAVLTVTCRVCQYPWIPRQDPSAIKKCPRCGSRFWNGQMKKKNIGATPAKEATPIPAPVEGGQANGELSSTG